MRKLITIASINFKDSPRTREELCEEAILDYAKAYRDEQPLPPPILYQTSLNGLLVADGMHRLEALQRNRVRQTLCEVRQGTRADCFNASVVSNLHHGVRRTNADKRQAIATAIAIYPEIADLKIAELCHVSHDTVKTVRELLVNKGTINERKAIKTADGKTRPVHKQVTSPKKQIRKSDSNEDIGSSVAASRMVHLAAGDKSPPNAPVIVDSTGYPIPEKAVPIWERKFEPIALIEDLREVRHQLEGYSAAKDNLFAEVNLNAADCELESLISRLQGAVPYAVCPSCQGKLLEKCTNCGKRGMVSRTKFERTDPALLKVRSLNASPKRLPA
jgi:hypothetical protein